VTEPHRDADAFAQDRGAVDLVDATDRPAEFSHPDVRAGLSDYLEGNLSPARQRIFDAHLRVCPDCRAFRDTLRETVHALGSLPSPAARPSAKRRILEISRSAAATKR
jgi:anti-sigma factor RsiW